MNRGLSAKKSDQTKVSNGFNSRDNSNRFTSSSTNENILKTDSKIRADQGGSSRGFIYKGIPTAMSTSGRGGSVAPPSKQTSFSKPTETSTKIGSNNIYGTGQPMSNYIASSIKNNIVTTNAPYQQQILTRNPIGSGTTILKDKTNTSSMNGADSYQTKPPNYPYDNSRNENRINSKNSFSIDQNKNSDYDIRSGTYNKPVYTGFEIPGANGISNQTPSISRYNQISPKEASREQLPRHTYSDSRNVSQPYENKYSDRKLEQPIPPQTSKPTSYIGPNPFHSSTSSTPVQGRDSYVNSHLLSESQQKSTSSFTYSNKTNGYMETSSTKHTNGNYSEGSSNLLSQDNKYSNLYNYSKGNISSDYEERKSDREKTVQQHKVIHSPTKDYSQVEPRGLVGLKNIGNTCFMNSILQCLFNTPMFSDYFLNKNHKKEKNPKNKGLADAFANLLEKIRNHSGNPSNYGENTSKVKSAIEDVNSMFSGYDQHDAQELLKAVLEGINDDVNRVTKKPPYKELKIDPKKSLQDVSTEWYEYMLGRDNSIVTDLFCGQLLSKIICSVCQFESLAFDNFWDLSLSFTRGLSMLEGCDISRMIEHFLKEEVLDDPFYCEKCKQRTKSTKRFVIWRLPKILVIHLKRFHYGKFRKEKLSNNVIFPVDNLDLSEFVRESTDSSTSDPRYSLYGIVNHAGSLYGGHYTSECMNPYNRKWYNFNDDYVRETSVTEEKYNRKGGSSPYVLFYVKTKNLC